MLALGLRRCFERKSAQVFEGLFTMWAHGQRDVPAAVALAEEKHRNDIEHLRTATLAGMDSSRFGTESIEKMLDLGVPRGSCF